MLPIAFTTKFEDPDAAITAVSTAIAAGAVPQVPTTTGVVMLCETILTKFTFSSAMDCDVAALTSLLRSRLCDDTFLRSYGYPFVVKLLDAVYQSGLPGASRRASVAIGTRSLESAERATPPFGPMLFYQQPLAQRDKELTQLCRLAHACLVALARSTPSIVETMIPRTRAKVIGLLELQDNARVLHYVLLCINVHLKACPLKCTELIDVPVVDTVLAFASAEASLSTVRASALTSLRLMLLDPKTSVKPFGLVDKLLSARAQLVGCLRDASFDVKKQALVLIVDLAFHFQDDAHVRELAAVFSESEMNQTLLADLFASLSASVDASPEAGYALQLLVRLVVRLDLIALTDTEQLVSAICMTLQVQTDATFLRPLLVSCLLRIASDVGNDRVLARTSRLDTITDLLCERLTLGELRSVGELLVVVAERHEGIRRYLASAASDCIHKVARVFQSFFEVSTDVDDAASRSAAANADVYGDISDQDAAADSVTSSEPHEMRFVVKMAAGKRVFISHYTDVVYQQVRASRWL